MLVPATIARPHATKLSAYTTIVFLVFFSLANAQGVHAKPAQTAVGKETPAAGISKQEKEPAKSKGAMLYENHCRSCHESNAHLREKHKAKNFGDIQYWVQRWSQHLKLKWTEDEIKAVAEHVNNTYYQY